MGGECGTYGTSKKNTCRVSGGITGRKENAEKTYFLNVSITRKYENLQLEGFMA